MIAAIEGKLVEKLPPCALINVNGLTYEIQMPMTCFYDLPAVNETVHLFTHFVVREDAQLLYGFHNRAQRSLFQELIKLNGVGPKLALAILSGLSFDEFIVAVQNDDLTRLTKIPGVGKKTAERLLIEMRDRLKNLDAANAGEFNFSPKHAVIDSSEDALAAMLALGYKQAQAQKAIDKFKGQGLDTETLIKSALKSLM